MYICLYMYIHARVHVCAHKYIHTFICLHLFPGTVHWAGLETATPKEHSKDLNHLRTTLL